MTITKLGSTIDTNSGTHSVVATPNTDDVIVIITVQSGSTTSVAPTGSNPSFFTKIGSALSASSGNLIEVWIGTIKVPSTVSKTFTHAPGTTTGGGLIVYSVSGLTLKGASVAAKFALQSNHASGAAPTPVLPVAANTNNGLIGAVLNATNPAGLTPRASWTGDVNTGYSTPTTGVESMHINSGETASSIAWGSNSASAFGSVVLELDASDYDVRFESYFDGSSQNLSFETPETGLSWSAVWTDTGSDQLITNGSGEAAASGLAGGGFIYTANINSAGAANSVADGRVQCTIKANPTSTNPLYLVSRYQGTGDFYLMGFFGTFIRMYKCVGGTMSQVGSDFTYTTAVEDRICLNNYGSTFDVIVNGVLKTSFSDSSITSAGRNGLAAGDVTNRINNSFSAGTWRVDNFYVTYDATTTPSALTKSLQYVVKTTTAITKSVQYSLQSTTTVNLTKSLKYTVRTTPAALTKSVKYTVRTTPAALTKSVKYTVRTTHAALTKSLKYTVRTTPAALTKSVKYTVKTTPSALIKSVRYTVKTTPAALTKSLKYTVVHTLTKSLKYTVRTTHATLTKSVKYTVRTTPAALAKSLKYTVRTTHAALTKSVKYTVRTTHTALTKSLQYVVAGTTTINLTKSLKYAVQTTPSALTKSLRYTVITTPTTGHNTTLNLPTAVSQDATGSFSIGNSTGIETIGGVAASGATNSFTVTLFNGLSATGFGFNIPSTATIFGIQATINRHASQNISNRFIQDNTVKLLKAGSQVGSNLADTVTQYTTPAFVDITYGDASNLWGTTWTPSDINNTNFGLYFRPQGKDSSGGTTSVDIDYVELQVWYTLPGIQKALKYTVKITPSALTKSLKYTVRVTPSALTKSVQYVIAGTTTTDVTKSLKYTVRTTPSALTKSLKYTVRTTHAAVTKSVRYTVRTTPSALTKSLKYTVRTTPAALTKSLKYTVRTTHTALTKSVKYTVRTTPAALAKSVKYTVRTTHAALTKSVKYTVRTTHTALTKSLQYVVASTFGGGFGALYFGQAYFGKANTTGANSLIITKSLKYTVHTTHTALTKSVKYTVRTTHAALTKSLKYTVKSSTTFTKSLKYTIKTTPSALTKSLKYTVRTTHAAVTKSVRYTVRTTPSALAKSLKYTVKTSPVITKSLKYTVRTTHAALTKSVKYTVKTTPAVLTKSVKYVVKTNTTLTKSVKYIISLTSIIITKQVSYTIFGRVKITKQVSYSVNKYLDEYVPQGTIYTDEYNTPGTMYTDEYVPQGTIYTDEYNN